MSPLTAWSAAPEKPAKATPSPCQRTGVPVAFPNGEDERPMKTVVRTENARRRVDVRTVAGYEDDALDGAHVVPHHELRDVLPWVRL
jgi:hypothetical protein